MTGSFIGKCRPTDGIERVPINIDPAVRKRLRDLLEDFPEFHTVGYSAFINRAVELAEGEAMDSRRREAITRQPNRTLRERVERGESAFKYVGTCPKCQTEMGVNMYGMGTCPSCGHRRNPL